MELFVLSFLVIGLAVLGMAAGVLARGSELKGTCATLGGDGRISMACEICTARHRRAACREHLCEPSKIKCQRTGSVPAWRKPL